MTNIVTPSPTSERFGADAGTGPDPSWKWEDSRWRAIVNKVRAGPSLKPEQWPGGARAAVALSFDSDHETVVLREGGASPGGLAIGEYGARVGVPRIRTLLDKYDIRASFFVPAVIAKLYPKQQRDLVEIGHEIGIHGWIHERNNNLDPEVEHELTRRAADVLAETTGVEPVGIRTPSWDFSESTLEIIRDIGLLYDSSLMADDEPYELIEDGKPTGIIELPPEWIRDDYPYFNMDRFSGLRPHTSPRTVLDIWKDEFDLAFEEGGLFLLTMHPHIIGHRSRILMLQELIKYVRSCGKVWFATHAEIANYVKSLGSRDEIVEVERRDA